MADDAPPKQTPGVSLAMQETLTAVNVIQNKGAWTRVELEQLLRIARWRKPPDFNATSISAQRRYHGIQKAEVEEAIGKVFTETDDMPVAPINWLKLIARLDAGVYVTMPDRYLEDAKTGERIKPEDPRSKLFAWALKKSRFHHQMAESERRALITPGVVFGNYVWLKEPGDDVGYPWIDLYWPHDIEVINHWSQPLRWKFAYVVAIRQAAPGMTSPEGFGPAYQVVEKLPTQWYRVWSRVPPVTSVDGTWGPWQHALVSTTGEVADDVAIPTEYKGKRLPAFLLQLSDPEGYPFVLEDVDLIDVVDDLNVRRSNESFVVNMQGHDQAWTNDRSDTGVVKGGPDSFMQVLPGSTVGLLSPNPKLADMRESRKLALRELAISRGNSPDAYATEPGPPLSGVAKRIANLTHDVRIAEQALLMQQFEESEALPILLDLLQTYHPDCQGPKGIRFDDVIPRMAPRKPPTFEEPTAKQLRTEAAVDRGWITEERGAFENDYYPDVESARRAIEVIQKEAPPPPPPDPPFQPTTQRVATFMRKDPQAAPDSVQQGDAAPAAKTEGADAQATDA